MKATRFVFPSVAIFSMFRVFRPARKSCVLLNKNKAALKAVLFYVAPNAVAKGILQNYSRYAP